MTTRPSSIPTSLNEMIELADFYLERFHQSQSVVDLFPAVLATVHVVDWFVEGTLHKDINIERPALEERFADWKTLKEFGNGLKHAVRAGMETTKPSARLLQTTKGLPEFKHPDWWQHAGAPYRDFWQIEHQGQFRSVYSLCYGFLVDFKVWVVPQMPPTSSQEDSVG